MAFRCSTFFVFITTLIIIGFIQNSFQIYTPNDQEPQKPVQQSIGIKTTNWRNNPKTYRLDHNYSRVLYQNPPINSDQHQEIQPTEYLNAHTYGNRPVTIVPNTQNEKLVIFRRRKEKAEIDSDIKIYSECPKGATGQFVYELSCNQFLNCWKGRGYVQNCAPGTLFNPKTLECDYIYKVNCLTGPRRNTIVDSDIPDFIEQVNCPKEFTGLIPNYTDCTKFISCSNGLQMPMTCPNGTLFDVTRNVCDHSYKAKCFTKSNNLEQDKCSNYCSKSNSQEVKCPNNAAGLFKHPIDCSKFLNCANGLTYIQDCAPGTLFNENLKICDFPYNVECPKNDSDHRTDFEVANQSFDCSKCGRKPNYKSVTSIQTQYGVSTTTPRNYYSEYNPNYRPTDAGSYLNGNEFGVKSTTSERSWYNPNYNQHYPKSPNVDQKLDWQESVVSPNQPTSNVNNNERRPIYSTRKPFATKRPTKFREPLTSDYEDYFGPNNNKLIQILATTTTTTGRTVEKSWPPPFPSTDVNADYVFEYEDTPSMTLIPENSINNNFGIESNCEKSVFYCSANQCIKKSLVCNGVKDCPNGKDEIDCTKYLQKFQVYKNSRLSVLEKERWDNVSYHTCALLCLEAQNFLCKSFNYRKIDRTCFLTNTNIGLTGALISYYPCDYYELISERINCQNMFECPNRKCINKLQLCDGHNDCGDRIDEKNCQPNDFGYSIQLTGTESPNEGNIEVTAFGRTGYICDDKFGLNDATVACKELGFHLGASEVKSNSFYVFKTNQTTTTAPFYMMDDVTCLGNETRLMDCDFSGWGVHNCLGQEIVGVKCKTPQEKCPKEYWQCDTGQECLPLAFVCDGLLDCTDGSDEGSQHCDAPTEIRLAEGRVPNEGRIEIRHHNTWGTICDDDFNEDAAKVVCNYLGYKGSVIVKKDGFFGEGNGPIWLDQVFCSGNETKIEECMHWNWGEHNCEHNEDVGVICSATQSINLDDIERHSSYVISADYPRECGYRKDNQFNIIDDVHFRVVRGSVARKGDYPWQAAIRVKGKTNKSSHWCGAVVIAETFVLTAAHCLIGYPKGAYQIVAGDYDIDEDEGTEQIAHIDDYYIHENFRKGHKMNNDIALIKLKGHGFHLNSNIQPICLPDLDTNYELNGLNCTISGFGSIQSGQSGFSHQLRAGWVPIQKIDVCKMPHVYGTALTDGMICAGSLDEGIDACDGDSGGPLACLQNGVFTLYGLTSWGQRCGYANKPGVYVKIAHYRNWLDDALKKYSKTN